MTANAVTIASAAGSAAIGAVAWFSDLREVFLVIPLWLLVRMALNAIDGMLAREFHQQSALGGYLNELGDVVSDAALYAPFALIAPFVPFEVVVVVILSLLTEFAGALGPLVGSSRRYDGPMGKSDRAVVFGALGLWVGTSALLPQWSRWAMPIIAALLVLTIINRVGAGLREVATMGSVSR